MMGLWSLTQRFPGALRASRWVAAACLHTNGAAVAFWVVEGRVSPLGLAARVAGAILRCLKTRHQEASAHGPVCVGRCRLCVGRLAIESVCVCCVSVCVLLFLYGPVDVCSGPLVEDLQPCCYGGGGVGWDGCLGAEFLTDRPGT